MIEFTDIPPYKWKTVRVFISSTFRDFHAERDYLIKYVFPELRQWCEKHKLHLIDIDLRWGVTEKEAESGKVIELCLEQIDGCRPFFICMLGSRYGWIPNEIERNKVNAETLKIFPDLKEKWKNLSVTHLEILHAALSPLHGEEPVPHSFFYFRDKKSLPDENELKQYSTEQKIEYLETFLEEDPQKTEKLEDLKKEINKYLVKEKDQRIFPYTPQFDPFLPNPEDDNLRGRFTAESLSTFGNKVKEHLLHALEIQFAGRMQYLSEKREEDSLENERGFHEAFIENRTSLFIGRTELLRRLHDYVNSNSNGILAVYGESGSGKSALLAKFYREYKFDKDGNEINQDVLFIPHFIGASPSSTASHSMLRRICEELKNKFNYEDEIPFDPKKLVPGFKDFLERAKSKVIILIDGLNQLDEAGKVEELNWLPYELPENVKIIASTLEGKAKISLEGLTNEKLDVGELDKDVRREIIREMPSVFAKTLEEKHINVLLKKKATSNPLYLKVALEELRLFGSFEKLEAKIRDLPDTVIDMFVDVIERLEKEVDKELVKQLFCLLECSRYGLTAIELEELLNDDKKDHIIILRQLRDYFISRDGLIDFFHRGLSKAVRHKYDLENESIKWHRTLAGYFGEQALNIDKKRSNLRKLSVLPFQQTYGKMWEDLFYTLTDTEFLEQKNTHFTVYDLLDDYRTALATMPQRDGIGEQRSVIQTFNKAIDQASFILKDKPELSFSQIYNRLQWQTKDIYLLKNKLAFEKNRFRRPWFRLITRPAESSNLIRVFSGHNDWVTACAISPDGKRIVSAGANDTTLKLWDVETGMEISTLKGHSESVETCAFSHDGERIISGGCDNTLRLWDSKTKELILIFKGHKDIVWTCAFSPDDKHIVSSGFDGTLRLWDVMTGECLKIIKGQTGHVMVCAFSPDGKLIASGGDDGRLRLWNAETAEELKSLKADMEIVEACAFSPDGQLIVTGGEEKTLKLWDVETGQQLATFKGDNGVKACAISPDGRRIISAGWLTMRMWDIEAGKELYSFKGHNEGLRSCVFSYDGKLIVSAGEDKTIRLWHSEPGDDFIQNKGHSSWVTDCVFSTDGRYIYSRDEFGLLRRNGETGEDPSNFDTGFDLVNDPDLNPENRHIFISGRDVAISPDGKFIVSKAQNKYLKFRDSKTEEKVSILVGISSSLLSYSFSPDGKLFASCSFGDAFVLWDVRTGVCLKTFIGHSDTVLNCAFSPDGKRIISASKDNTLKLWDIEKDEEILSLLGHKERVDSCTFTPDGRRILSCSSDNTLRLWDARTGECLNILKGHTAGLYADSPERLNFNIRSDGQLIISGSREDMTLRLWDTNTGKELYSLIGYSSEVLTCTFSPDGNRIALGDLRGQVLILYIENVKPSVPIVSPFRILSGSNIKATCKWCGKVIPVSEQVLDYIVDINRNLMLGSDQSSYLHLPDQAWESPRLLSECSLCHKPLKFNPFIVVHKDWDRFEPKDAKEADKKALQLKEDDKFAHFNLGLIYKNENSAAEAKYHFKRALELGIEQARPFLKKWWQY